MCSNTILTLEEPPCVKDLHHSIPLHFAGPRTIVDTHSAPEHAALAQALDEDALSVGSQKHATLQVPEELACHLPLTLVLDKLQWWEADVLEAVPTVDKTVGKGLAGGDAAALWVGGHQAAHGLPSIVERDDHAGEGCVRTEKTHS